MFTETNLVDQVWEDHGRPDPPNEGLVVMDISFTGMLAACLGFRFPENTHILPPPPGRRFFALNPTLVEIPV